MRVHGGAENKDLKALDANTVTERESEAEREREMIANLQKDTVPDLVQELLGLLN